MSPTIPVDRGPAAAEPALRFEISSYWHTGGAASGGFVLDNLAKRDAHDLPYVPGRTVKGLVRDACLRAEHWGRLDRGTTDRWFGTSTETTGRTRYETEPGLLGFDDAVLPKEITAVLATREAAHLAAHLYRHIHATSIDARTGHAKDKSLRGTEVVVPLTLRAPIFFPIPGTASSLGDCWPSDLERALSLIRGLGMSRSRGLGRVRVRLEHPDLVRPASEVSP
ncbi:RAMP superfamily [Sulfidibacter corallicola]|uniref:CRISPR type III-associated protein domain-containing protein n=1 Tax=Sulfidibacter corallicola TaxID=2818388 RepID=A0A8A4TLT8_SULCO|nr:RAMP superfamily CRISPR-associated protein [Sulfidibacter corallicola]QTD50533.1 hypothetical protein J3U87_33535 [Sulfidibacter corallicola]